MICDLTDVQTQVEKVSRGPLVCRRSSRLHNKYYKRHVAWCINSQPLGYFTLLPTELLHHIINTLTIEEVGILSLTSKAVRDVVGDYTRSRTGMKHLQLKILTKKQQASGNKRLPFDSAQSKHFKYIGLLLKRTTCLFPTRERLKILETFVQQLQCTHRLFTCQALSVYGNLVSAFTRGWEQRECLRAYVAVSESQNMTSKLLIILSGNPGTNSQLEMRTRRFFRHVLLDQCKTMDDLSMWLNFILRPFPMVHQARILYLLYGPLQPQEDVVFWACMGEAPLGSRHAFYVVTPLGELAMALKALWSHHCWSDDDVISVLEELTDCPSEWVIENVARLLILCGEPIALKVLGSKAINGKMEELGGTIVAFSVVLYDEGLRMSWLFKIVKQLCKTMRSPQDVRSFLASISSTYVDFLVSVRQSAADDVSRSFHHIAMAQVDFMEGMMLRLFDTSQPRTS